jgi:hypothetical protein
VAIGTFIEPVPVTGFAPNFSPIPRIAPPPLGNEIAGAEKPDCFSELLFSGRVCGNVLSQHQISLLLQGSDWIDGIRVGTRFDG